MKRFKNLLAKSFLKKSSLGKRPWKEDEKRSRKEDEETLERKLIMLC